jgi:DNA polymerase zeta
VPPEFNILYSSTTLSEIVAIIYASQKSDVDPYVPGILAIDNGCLASNTLRTTFVENMHSELDLLNGLVDVVVDLDPDILVGWDVQSLSWGYLIHRGKIWGMPTNFSEHTPFHRFTGLDLPSLLSRVSQTLQRPSLIWESRNSSTVKVVGRHVLNLWRLMRTEITLSVYTFENVAFHTLRRRCESQHPLQVNLVTAYPQGTKVLKHHTC